MNTNNENINKMSTKSKIPLPLDPLPAFSENLLKNRRYSELEKRYPLKTINNQQSNYVEAAGPSKKMETVLNTNNFTFDTRHITRRQKNEKLDWDYSVFKDECDKENSKENSVIVISDNDDSVIHASSKQTKYFVANNQRNCLDDLKRNATPVLHCLEPCAIKNIKKSLKRPHSRELQGLSTVTKRDQQGDEKHKRRLNFNDRLRDRLQSPDSSKKLYMSCLCRDYTSDMFTYLLHVENKSIIPRISCITRACILNWLVKVNGVDGDPTTLQTACWYFDSVLAVRNIELHKLQLVAAACYWISQKLHGPAVNASRLVKYSNRAFSASQLMHAEKAILKKLNFPRHPVVPQDYITYLSWCCDNAHPGEIEVAATFLSLAGVMVDKALSYEYPSVIAVAAVRNAVLLLGKNDLITRLQSCYVFKAAEKKSPDLSHVCSIQRAAVRLMYEPSYEYQAALEQYGCAPHFIAKKIVKAAYELTATDPRVANKD